MSDTGTDRHNPLVSVVIPAHNARTTLERALRSVVAQTYSHFEVVIVDDASVDDTADLARSFPGLDIRVERLDSQSGAAAARNRGIEVSRGEFIAFLDADDEWTPEKTALQLPILLNDPALSTPC
jgi:glycosyltransferase involved in cell wall biosynthesis